MSALLRLLLLLILLATIFCRDLSSQTIDSYRTIPMARLETTPWTHVCVVGPVTYVRLQRDKDIHVTLDDGKTKIVLEIIPQIPLERPKKGTIIRACGISRYDRYHRWPEIHPVTSWRLHK